MNKIKVGDKVRILAKPDVFANETEGAFRYFGAEILRDQLGTVIPAKGQENEVGVELDNTKIKIIIQKRFLFGPVPTE